MTTRRTKLMALLVLVGVFVLGALTGGGVTLLAVRHRVRTMLEGPADQMETRGLVFVLDRALNLTAEQKTQIEQIHQRHLPELNRVRRKSEPELAVIRGEAESEIRAVLDPQQQTKFDSMVDTFEGRRKRMLGLSPTEPWPAPSRNGEDR